MRRTKIVCTIGPKTCRYEQLKQLAELGMNVVRLNMSHGDHDWHRQVIKAIRTINEKGDYSIAVMLDTKGPEVRTGDLREEMILQKGDDFTFTVRRQPTYEMHCTEVSYDAFIADVQVGDILLIDGGMISFIVQKKTDTDVMCECIEGGTLGSRRHLTIKGKSAKLPSITDKDWSDIAFGIEEGIDFVALSFVKTSAVIQKVREHMRRQKASVDIIAKIESADSIDHLESIIEACDGVMVARGDLGAEVPLEEVPLLQERIVREARQQGKPAIVATHLLESMIIHPTPTRAEVTDIAEAVYQRADAVMLSGETAAGEHPFKSVEIMDRVVRRIEQKLGEQRGVPIDPSEESKHEIVRSAAIMANNIDAAALLVFTRRGFMGALLSRCRPNAPVYAFTNMSGIRRRLNLFWGVVPFRIAFSRNPEKTIQRAMELLSERHFLTKNDTIVIVSDILAGEKFVETIQVRTMA